MFFASLLRRATMVSLDTADHGPAGEALDGLDQRLVQDP
jgi:hypothetical protein